MRPLDMAVTYVGALHLFLAYVCAEWLHWNWTWTWSTTPAPALGYWMWLLVGMDIGIAVMIHVTQCKQSGQPTTGASSSQPKPHIGVLLMSSALLMFGKAVPLLWITLARLHNIHDDLLRLAWTQFAYASVLLLLVSCIITSRCVRVE